MAHIAAHHGPIQYGKALCSIAGVKKKPQMCDHNSHLSLNASIATCFPYIHTEYMKLRSSGL